MDELESFVKRKNVELYIARLTSEDDVQVRAAVRQLLTREIDGFGSYSEQLDIVDESIGRVWSHAIAQKSRINSLNDGNESPSVARQLFANLQDIHELLQVHRKAAIKRINDGP